MNQKTAKSDELVTDEAKVTVCDGLPVFNWRRFQLVSKPAKTCHYPSPVTNCDSSAATTEMRDHAEVSTDNPMSEVESPLTHETREQSTLRLLGPIATDVIPAHGVCPFCGRYEGYVLEGCAQWFGCSQHQTKWIGGFDESGQWRNQTTAERREVIRSLMGYREVQPLRNVCKRARRG